MRRLTGRLLGRLGLRRARDERGAVAVTVAVMLVPLLGLAALAVDVAAVHAYRQQLSNAADSAALAVALDCARAQCGNAGATASTLAQANTDQHGGSGASPSLSVAQSSVETARSTVTVTASGTQSHWFGPVIGHDSSSVSATSVAAWSGVVTATTGLPLAISYCEFSRNAPRPVGTSTALVTISGNGAGPCPGGSGTPSGGFGWLETASSQACSVTADVGSQVGSNTGNTLPNACKRPGAFAGLVGSTVMLPVFKESGGNGGNGWYRVYAWAAFHVVGYNFGGSYSGGASCSGGSCLRGYFAAVAELTDETTRGPVAPDLGARLVYLTE